MIDHVRVGVQCVHVARGRLLHHLDPALVASEILQVLAVRVEHGFDLGAQIDKRPALKQSHFSFYIDR